MCENIGGSKNTWKHCNDYLRRAEPPAGHALVNMWEGSMTMSYRRLTFIISTTLENSGISSPVLDSENKSYTHRSLSMDSSPSPCSWIVS